METEHRKQQNQNQNIAISPGKFPQNTHHLDVGLPGDGGRRSVEGAFIF